MGIALSFTLAFGGSFVEFVLLTHGLEEGSEVVLAVERPMGGIILLHCLDNSSQILDPSDQ